jgi:dolichol-phosphate mannosyltransferase
MPTKKTDSKPVFSIVAPVFNEIGSVEEFYKTVVSVMTPLKQTWELMLVDDGSTDGSTNKIRELASKDTHIKPVIFARNFGHQIAVTAGLDYTAGDAVIIIDAT